MSAGSNAPVIIRRKKVVKADGHHGGAWKVAYADFVTAMMAFFLLMWLLGATNENQRKGLADFFNPTIPVNRVSGGGEGAFGGDSVFSENTLSQSGTGAGTGRPTQENQARGNTGVETGEEANAEGDQAAKIAAIEEALQGRGGESQVTELLRRHVISRITDEGLIVEIFDDRNSSLFVPGTDEPTETLRSLLFSVAEVFGTVKNEIAIQAYVASSPLVVADDPSWELSQSRANHVREEITRIGVSADRVARVTGFADRKPTSENPMSPRNNRVELILLRDRI